MSPSRATFREVGLPFAIFTAIWGSTWIVIRDQLGTVPPQWSVAYRFIIAAAAMALVARWKGESLRLGRTAVVPIMTDRQGALGVLVSLVGPEREQALQSFYERFELDPLVIDKWFALQAGAQRNDTLDEVERLASHPAFTMQNPNRLRSLAGNFGMNHWVFNDASGRGYRFLADMIIAADKLNPQIAARLVPPLGRWRRFEPKRSEMMREQLERIANTRGLSRDVYEQATKSLA